MKHIDNNKYVCQNVQENNQPYEVCTDDSNYTVNMNFGDESYKFNLIFDKDSIYFKNPIDYNEKCYVYFNRKRIIGIKRNVMTIRCQKNFVQFVEGLGLYELYFDKYESFYFVHNALNAL